MQRTPHQTPAKDADATPRKRGPRRVLVNFLVTEEERAQIDADAKRNGLSVSSLIRAALAFFRNHH